MSSPVIYQCLSLLPDDTTNAFAVSLLISYCSFSSLILSSVVIISFYIFSERFFLKREGLYDARAETISKKEYGFPFLVTIY